MAFLTYGRNSQDDLVHISEVERGGGIGLFCPFCSRPLVARKGRVVAPHFAHTAGGSCRPSRVTAELIPSFEGYFIYGLSAAQRQALAVALVVRQGGFFDTSIAGSSNPWAIWSRAI
jgi:hypothetical protein